MESGSKIKKFISIYFTVSAIIYLVIAATIGNLYFFLSGVFMALPMIGPFRNFLVKNNLSKKIRVVVYVICFVISSVFLGFWEPDETDNYQSSEKTSESSTKKPTEKEIVEANKKIMENSNKEENDVTNTKSDKEKKKETGETNKVAEKSIKEKNKKDDKSSKKNKKEVKKNKKTSNKKKKNNKKKKKSNKKNKAKKKALPVVTVDDVLENIDKYDGKTLYVEGNIYDGHVFKKDDASAWGIPLNGDIDGNYLFIEGKEPSQINYEGVVVKGKVKKEGNDIIITATKYKYNKATAIHDTQNEVDIESDFAYIKYAAMGYANMNWNQLLKNPTSLAGTITYIPGKVVQYKIEDGKTKGVIDTKGDDDIDDYVTFEINAEVYDINKGSIICPVGYIDDETEFYYNAHFDTYWETPRIIVDRPNLYKNYYTLNLDDPEISDFIFGTYIFNDAPYSPDQYFGETVEFTPDTIGGYSYTFKDGVGRADGKPQLVMCNKDSLWRGKNNAYVGMEFYIYGMTNYDSELSTMAIDLYGNNVFIKAADGLIPYIKQ